jgi:hypothetical protein
MNKSKQIGLLLAGAVLGLVVTLSVRGGAVAAQTSACAQWEVTSDELAAVTMGDLPEQGKTAAKKAPAGWEPFAIGPTGVLAYRRCTKQ